MAGSDDFRSVAEAILALAQDTQEEYFAARERDDAAARVGARAPKRAALERALGELSSNDLRKIEVLAYSGRDKQDFTVVHKRLTREDPEATIARLVNQVPFPVYLEAGLERAKDSDLAAVLVVIN